ncbi:Uncharacterised protein [Bordetella pertussis]|nr:Uncharacterised protein [Bordetella pertussis]
MPGATIWARSSVSGKPSTGLRTRRPCEAQASRRSSSAARTAGSMACKACACGVRIDHTMKTCGPSAVSGMGSKASTPSSRNHWNAVPWWARSASRCVTRPVSSYGVASWRRPAAFRSGEAAPSAPTNSSARRRWPPSVSTSPARQPTQRSAIQGMPNICTACISTRSISPDSTIQANCGCAACQAFRRTRPSPSPWISMACTGVRRAAGMASHTPSPARNCWLAGEIA